ncbi:hypothetical protein BASA83_012965 [Batrachochytrium salamandrivorans]|nr:hypothetical protein BASA83_012965 [Batrachochytrium salamandrivorans]
MDIDFARRGPLTTAERQQRFSQGLCLVCVFLFLHSLPSKKLLLPGTLRLGPLSHVDTFFVDCGADDLLWTLNLQQICKSLSLNSSTPITLRLADGDSSSSLTHRTVPLQLHIGKHVETATFYVTDLCHGFILGYSWLERHNPRINWVSLPFLAVFLIPSSLESMQSDVYPFVEVSPISDVSVPSDILSSFSSLFSEDQAETLPPHRDFDCSIDLKPGSEPFHGKIYQLTRRKIKVMQEWIKDNLRKELLRTLSTGKIFTTLDLRGAYNLLRIKEGDESKTSFITKYGQFEVLGHAVWTCECSSAIPAHDELLVRDVIGKHVLGLPR